MTGCHLEASPWPRDNRSMCGRYGLVCLAIGLFSSACGGEHGASGGEPGVGGSSSSGGGGPADGPGLGSWTCQPGSVEQKNGSCKPAGVVPGVVLVGKGGAALTLTARASGSTVRGLALQGDGVAIGATDVTLERLWIHDGKGAGAAHRPRGCAKGYAGKHEDGRRCLRRRHRDRDTGGAANPRRRHDSPQLDPGAAPRRHHQFHGRLSSSPTRSSTPRRSISTAKINKRSRTRATVSRTAAATLVAAEANPAHVPC